MDIILEGSKMKTEQDFHNQISKLLDFGEYYGNNLNALWDRLSTDVERPIFIIWKDHLCAKKMLEPYVFNRIINIFEKTKNQDIDFKWKDKFDYFLD
ncbi:barstar family protein [Stenoxybacter acetivorans]|uniref:barstar family protein n=1 Tax=Stenoxybacter acetivorans TaxID=422441 RepID=UPI00055C1C90|nr:barstar family protein [Stenoxybacter acetivorans]